MVDEDPVEELQVSTKRYVDQHAGGGNIVTDLSGDYIFVLTPLINKYSKFEIFSTTTLNLLYGVNGGNEQVQEISVPYTVFLNNKYKKIVQTNSPFYFIDNIYDSANNVGLAIKTYMKSNVPDTLYFSFQNMSAGGKTSGEYSVYGGGKIMECLVVSQ